MRLRKSNTRLKQPRAVSPKKVYPTTNPVEGQGVYARPKILMSNAYDFSGISNEKPNAIESEISHDLSPRDSSSIACSLPYISLRH